MHTYTYICIYIWKNIHIYIWMYINIYTCCSPPKTVKSLPTSILFVWATCSATKRNNRNTKKKLKKDHKKNGKRWENYEESPPELFCLSHLFRDKKKMEKRSNECWTKKRKTLQRLWRASPRHEHRICLSHLFRNVLNCIL